MGWAGTGETEGRGVLGFGGFLLQPVAGRCESVLAEREVESRRHKAGIRQELETWGAGLGRSDVEGDVMIFPTYALESLLSTGGFLTPSLGLRHKPRVTTSPVCVLRTCSRRVLAVAFLGKEHPS